MNFGHISGRQYHFARRRTRLAGFCVFLLAETLICTAQTDDLRFKGQIGGFGELYSMQGIDSRRPGNTGRVFVRGNLLWKDFKLPVNIRFSTEDDILRQTINRLSFGLKNDWFDVAVGDGFPRYSPLILNGVFLRGMHTKFNHSNIYLQFNAGQNQRAIEGDSALGRSGSFTRYLYAGRLGYDNREFFGYFQALRAKDENSSVAYSGFRKPQENLVFGGQSGAYFLNRSLNILLEYNHSFWSRNIRDELPGTGQIPDAFSSLFRERSNSRSGNAFRTDIKYRKSKYSLEGSYQRIGTDYYSMGVYGIQTDWQEFRVRGNSRFLNNKLNLNGFVSSKSNNLDGEKSATTTRISGGLSGGYQYTPEYALRFNYSLYTNSNDAIGLKEINTTSHNIQFRPAATWRSPQYRDNAQMTIGYMKSADFVDRPSGSREYSRYNIGAFFSRNYTSGHSASANYMFSNNKSSFLTSTSHVLTVTAEAAVVEKVLSAGASLSLAREKASVESSSNSRYSLRLFGKWTILSTLRLQANASGRSYSSATGRDYTEIKTSVTIVQTF